MPKIRTLILQFANMLLPNEITQFRGAAIASLKQNNILYHNHDENGVVYKYPRIQYKRIHQKAAIVGINEGVEAIHELFTSGNFVYRIGNKKEAMLIQSIDVYETNISICQEMKNYRLHNWLPLNSKNYEQFQSTDSLRERIAILERVLIGNILSFLKGVGIHIEEKIEIQITDITNQKMITYKNVKLMAFDIEFKTNIQLPQYIGIGKNASIGCGVLTKITN